MDSETLQSTNKLLRVIVALLLRRKDEQVLTLKQQIQILDDLGMRPAEIAEILGRKNTHINKELSGIRKSRKEAH
jgi:DNA-binding transcriptional MerR regulator